MVKKFLYGKDCGCGTDGEWWRNDQPLGPWTPWTIRSFGHCNLDSGHISLKEINKNYCHYSRFKLQWAALLLTCADWQFVQWLGDLGGAPSISELGAFKSFAIRATCGENITTLKTSHCVYCLCLAPKNIQTDRYDSLFPMFFTWDWNRLDTFASTWVNCPDCPLCRTVGWLLDRLNLQKGEDLVFLKTDEGFCVIILRRFNKLCANLSCSCWSCCSNVQSYAICSQPEMVLQKKKKMLQTPETSNFITLLCHAQSRAWYSRDIIQPQHPANPLKWLSQSFTAIT